LATLKSLFIKHVFSEARSNTLKISDIIGKLLDTFHLFLQILGFDEIAHLSIAMRGSNSMELKKSLVDGLLHLKSSLHGVDPRAPIVQTGFGDVLEDDATSSHVLVLHELPGMFPFLVGLLEEELVEPRESYVVPVEVVGHREIHVTRIQLHVDLFVDASLALSMVVLTGLRSGHFLHLLT